MSEFDRLVKIMARLRGPDGCPWDAEQDHRSLRPYLLEEAYEVAEALDSGEAEKTCEELGDLLLQIVFHAQIAAEEGEYDIEDVARGINEKLIYRHPHVFSDVHVNGSGDVLRNWEQLKKKEKEDTRKSVLDGLPAAMPALQAATKIQKKASRVGFDWEDREGPDAKIDEELDELHEAIDNDDRAAMERELGDLLFAICNLARFLNIDAESALRESTERFRRRFQHIEQAVEGQDQSMLDMDIDQLEELWQQAKAAE
ncbi:MAG: nucleoside triphosphate pyrophosphohydrolase [Armatimonadota bacterium]